MKKQIDVKYWENKNYGKSFDVLIKMDKKSI